jgi:hypothetical protein
MSIKYFINVGLYFFTIFLVYKIGYDEGLNKTRLLKTRHEQPITRATELPSLLDIHD